MKFPLDVLNGLPENMPAEGTLEWHELRRLFTESMQKWRDSQPAARLDAYAAIYKIKCEIGDTSFDTPTPDLIESMGRWLEELRDAYVSLQAEGSCTSA